MFERISLNALKFFYYVAKYSSVTLASKKLYVTQSAVSKQVANLELVLNISLFERRNKKLILTKEGEKLFQCCINIFSDLDECLNQIAQKEEHNKLLVLSCEPTLSMKWLIPRLTQFKTLGYGFDVVLVTGGGKIEFESNQIDLAIRRNDFDWGREIYSAKIADEYLVLVQKAHPSGLMKDVLLSNSRPNFLKSLNQIPVFKDVLRGMNKLYLDHFYLCLEGCLSGLGATILSTYMIEKELETNILEMLAPVFCDHSAYYLLSTTPFEQDPRKVIFLDWLKVQMAQSCERIAIS